MYEVNDVKYDLSEKLKGEGVRHCMVLVIKRS